jgi:hypothetical protein
MMLSKRLAVAALHQSSKKILGGLLDYQGSAGAFYQTYKKHIRSFRQVASADLIDLLYQCLDDLDDIGKPKTGHWKALSNLIDRELGQMLLIVYKEEQ